MFLISVFNKNIEKYGFDPCPDKVFMKIVSLIEKCVASVMGNVIQVAKEMKDDNVTVKHFEISSQVLEKLSKEYKGGAILSSEYFKAPQTGGACACAKGANRGMFGGCDNISFVRASDIEGIMSHFEKYKINKKCKDIILICVNMNLNNIFNNLHRSGVKKLKPKEIDSSIEIIAPFLK